MANTMISHDIESLANVIHRAEDTATAISPVSSGLPDFDIESAYNVQDELLRRRIERGEKLIGIKLGLTSRAKQKTMGIDSPTVSWLTDAMVLPTGSELKLETFIHPRAEPEIVVLTSDELCGPGMTAARAIASVSAVMGGIEIIDSRFHGYQFTLPDTIADNSSSGCFTLGSEQAAPRDLDLALEAVLLEVDGSIVDSATGAAVYGQPAEALAWAVNKLAERGLRLPAGSIVMTGGMTDAVPVTPGIRISAHFSHLGSIVVSVGAHTISNEEKA
jgi:2-oxo-3-hexenedioate decarboxylase